MSQSYQDSVARGKIEARVKKWSKELSKFLKSIEGKSREELLGTLEYHWNQHYGLKMTSKAQEGLIKSQSCLMGILEKSDREHRALCRESLKAMKVGLKRIEYLENILGVRKKERVKTKSNLAVGRKLSNEKRTAKKKTIEIKLQQAISDYYKAHSGHKVSNKELERYLGAPERGFRSSYSESTFTKKVAKVAAEIKRIG